MIDYELLTVFVFLSIAALMLACAKLAFDPETKARFNFVLIIGIAVILVAVPAFAVLTGRVVP